MARSSSRFGTIPLVLSAAFALNVFPAHLWAQATGQSTTSQPASTQSAPTNEGDQSNSSIPSVFETVVVTADRLNEVTREVTSNVTILDQNHIKASTAQTLTDLLVDQGFNSVSYNDVAGVQIRGFGQLSGPPENTNTVLILLNGKRTGNANLTLIGLENVERVEIIRGPSAVQYGSSAMGGVINIITKRGTEKPNASVELGAGSDALKRQKLAFGGAARGFDLAIGATNYGRDDLTAQGGRRWYHTAIDHNTNVNADLGYSIDRNNRASVSYNFGEIQSELSSGGIRPFSANTPTAAFTEYRKRTDSAAVSYTGSTPDKTLNWSANYSFGNYDQKPYANNLDTKFFNAQGDYTRSAFSASLGVDNYRYESDPLSWTSNDTGVYATGKARFLADQLIFSGGLRVDSYRNESSVAASVARNHTGGSVGVAYLPTRWLKLRANDAEGFKVPAPPQVAGDGSIYYLPNFSLQPEKGNTVEFGGDVGWKAVDASATWFHADWDNKIIGLTAPGTCSGGFGCYQYQNLKSSTLAGLEGSLSSDVAKAFEQSFSLAPYVSFTWLQTRRNNDSSQFIVDNGSRIDTLPNTPDWMVNYGVRYNAPGLKLSTQLNATHYGEMLTQDYSVVDFVTVFSAPYIHRPTGTVVNLSADKQLVALAAGHNKVTIRAEITNLFDAANEMFWGYPGPGRSFYAGLRYDY